MIKENQQKVEKVFSVSDYIENLNQGLKSFKAKIVGEVGKVDIYPSGHVYFSLRDEKDQSVINCIIWKSRYRLFNIEVKEGIKIIIDGRPDLYKQTGRLSFIAETVELAGEGVLKKEYEKLKKKLEDEGIFEESRKRQIPAYSQKIGIITSKQGAVLADFLSNIGNYGFKIKMVDSRVEGQSAIRDLLSAIKIIKKEDIEVLVIMRGGGSFESLQSFNNELLAREISNFPLPVIAAIGHDKDIPLAALAADKLVSTPSIAAAILGESWEQAFLLLKVHERDIVSLYENILEDAKFLVNKSIDVIYKIKDLIFDKYQKIEIALKIFFETFKNNLENNKNELKNLKRKSVLGFDSLLSIIKRQLEYSEKIIYLHNPETQIKLGYSIARSGGKLIKSIKDIKINEDMDVRVADGTIISKVKNIKKT